MTRLSWPSFLARHPHGHLLTGSVPPDDDEEIGTPRLRRLRDALARLIGKLVPSGDYTVTVVRETGLPEVHCAFEKEEDAERLGAIVRAASKDAGGAWASRRSFAFDDPTALAIEAAFATGGEIDERRGSSVG